MLLDHPSDEPTAIRTYIAAIFVSLELSRSTWLVTSLSPGKGERMSKHSVTAGNVAELLTLFAELRRKAEVRTGQSYPIITIQEAGLDGFWLHRVLQQNGIESHVVDRGAAKPKTRQDGPDRRRDTAAGAARLQARRAAGLRDGGRALARGGRSPEALPRAADIDRRAHHACEPDQGASVRAGHLRLWTAAARPAGAARGIAHRRRAGAAVAFEGADRPRA